MMTMKKAGYTQKCPRENGGILMNVLSCLVVIALCGVIAFFLYLFAGGNIPEKPRNVGKPAGGQAGVTVISPNLKVEQLDVSCKTVVETFIISVKKNRDWFISRPDGEGDIILKKTDHFNRDADCAFTVSNRHAVIACDDQGLFIQDNDSSNGMYIWGNFEPQEELAISNGLVIALGDQPIRFTLINRFARDEHATHIGDKRHGAPTTIRRKRTY